ncbi:ABC transporter substrate-binding protein [Thauera sinica]|uniref:ABC transporter substrate-binding protein n=1 Tax=Thauera sinica TaxID=2665146 RepID=A0ABW1AT16_9RHOO|nr:ABC transporter substrate-binding protein [Thauera sp. K11]ATE61357.1 branched-chain amino acid ABC transporter substrate-binding protein [Thauera sp. K11]
MIRRSPRSLLLSLLALAAPAFAQVHVGVSLSLTGPAASLGTPARNMVELLPREVDGTRIEYTVLDDASDPTNAVKNFHKLTEEHKVDVVIGSSTTPSTLSMVEPAARAGVPLVSVASGTAIVSPQDETRRWAFKAVQNEALMVQATVAHMRATGVKRLGFIGFNTAFGEGWLNEARAQAEAQGIQLVAVERYGQTDTSVLAQVLKLIAAKPDAVLVAGAGTPAALPQKTLVERGFKGRIYQTYGVANRDFLRVAGRDAEGAVFAVGPVLVADQLPSGNPVRAVATEVTARYEKAYGAGSMSIFAANAWDAGLLIREGLKAALAKEKPGTPAFRAALRDGMEVTRGLTTSQGVMNLSSADHVGYDGRAVALVEIRQGAWRYLGD